MIGSRPRIWSPGSRRSLGVHRPLDITSLSAGFAPVRLHRFRSLAPRPGSPDDSHTSLRPALSGVCGRMDWHAIGGKRGRGWSFLLFFSFLAFFLSAYGMETCLPLLHCGSGPSCLPDRPLISEIVEEAQSWRRLRRPAATCDTRVEGGSVEISLRW
jgi:hypothetical protein